MKFKLSISEPCHENWANMTPNEKGRFCAQCSKTVHDFTNHAPEEIADTLKNGNGHICGRVPSNMLNQEFTQAGYGKWGVVALAGAAALTQQADLNFPGQYEVGQVSHIQVNVQNNYYKISGSVLDEEGNPVGGATIQILNGEQFVAQGFSLSTGNFALYIDKTKTFSGPLTVRIQKDGFILNEETIIPSVTPDWKRTFTMLHEVIEETLATERVETIYETMGDVAYQTMYIEQEAPMLECTSYSVTGGAVAYHVTLNEPEISKAIEENYEQPKPEKVVAVFENVNKLNVFPNPAAEQITMELYYDKAYNAMIYDLSGKLIQQQSFTGNKLQMNVSELVPGNYIVYVLDVETQYSMSKKMVVVR